MAITDEALWDMEERLWTGSVDECAALFDEDCLMVFGETGILERDFALAAMRAAPRWASVLMSEKTIARPGKTTAVLAYRARAARDGAEPYNAYCSSTWRGADQGWKMIQHQQTKAN